MVDISKILIVQRKNLQEQALQVLEMAEGVGFEPTWGLSPKRFSRSLPKNTVSAQFGAVCAKTIPENPYFTRLFGTGWDRYELKRIDRNRYRPLVF